MKLGVRNLAIFQITIEKSKDVALGLCPEKNLRKSHSAEDIFLFYDEKEIDHEGTRTLNLPIRSRTPYPLGHAANHMKEKAPKCIGFGGNENEIF